MFNFFKRWWRPKGQDDELSAEQLDALHKLQAIQDRIMPRVREVLDDWRVNRLECSRVMSEEHFAERLVAIQDNGVHSFENIAKIEARALLSVWSEAKADRKQEFSQLLDEEAREFIEGFEIGPEIENLLDREIAEATIQLVVSIDAAIDEAIERRGETRSSDKSIAEMALPEILDFLKASVDELNVDDMIAAARRLTDIAMFDHDASDEERAAALRLIPALDSDIEAALQNEPGRFERYQEAAAHHRGTARHFGYGSLSWLVDEQCVTGAEFIPFIARNEHAELLPALLEMFEPENIHDIRGALLSELATARTHVGESRIEVLCRLANGDDGALTHLLDGRQLGVLRRAKSKPASAAAMLTELGVSL